MIPQNKSKEQPVRKRVAYASFAWAVVLFFFISLAMAVSIMGAAPGMFEEDASRPLWFRAGILIKRILEKALQPESVAVELIFLPLVACLGAWGACRCLLPDRFFECVIGGLVYGFAPCLLTLLAHGAAYEAFCHAVLPVFLLLPLLAREQGSKIFIRMALVLLALVALAMRPLTPVAVFVGVTALLHVRARSFHAGKQPPSWFWLAPFAAALLFYLAVPSGGWCLSAYPSVAGFRGKLSLAHRVAGLFVLRSSLVPGGAAWTAPSAYLGKVCLIFTALGLATRERAWLPWKAAWAIAFGVFLAWYLFPAWWLGLVFPAASAKLIAAPWLWIQALMLMAALLSALMLGRILDALGADGWPRVVLLLAIGWLLLVDAGQATPRGWSELQRSGHQEEPALPPLPITTQSH